VLLQGGVEVETAFKGQELIVERDPARGQVNKPGSRVEDLPGVDELKLDALGPGRHCFINERPRLAEITLVRSAQLGHDETGSARADGPARERDHYF
jgi:hypothetical protein